MKRSLWLVMAGVVGLALPLFAADDADLQTVVMQLQKQVAAQQKKIDELEGQNVDVAKLLEAQKENEAKLYAAAKGIDQPDWFKGLDFYGDLRLRYEGKSYRGYNKAQKDEGSNKRKDYRNRARFRLRFGFTKQMMDDQVEVGFRLASGDDNVPTSTNQTFTDSFSKKDIWIDRAYAKYTPKWLKGLTLIGGKMETPMVHTDMVWDSDVNPEGFWLQYDYEMARGFSPFVGAGYFIVQENYKSIVGDSSHDCTMWDVELGFNWKINKDVKWTFATNYYGWNHYVDIFNAAEGNDLPPGVKGFNIINITNKIDFKLFGMKNKVYFDWAHNCSGQDINYDYQHQDNAYAVGYKLGDNKKKGDWSFEYKYAYIEANAVVGYFADSDFGFANRKGHVIGAKYSITDDISLGGKVYLTQAVTGPEVGPLDTTTHVDMEWKF